jgi:hypothetical protein
MRESNDNKYEKSRNLKMPLDSHLAILYNGFKMATAILSL